MAEKKRKSNGHELADALSNRKGGIKQYNLAEGDNAKYTMHSLAILQMPPIEITNPDEVRSRTSEYFQMCVLNDMKPSFEGYALSLGLTRNELKNRIDGRAKCPREVVEILTRAYALLNAQMVDYVQNGKINPVAAIFLMRNTMHYTNNDDPESSDPNAGGDELTAEQIAEKYKHLPD